MSEASCAASASSYDVNPSIAPPTASSAGDPVSSFVVAMSVSLKDTSPINTTASLSSTMYAISSGGAPPTDTEIDELLALAGVAAHASARQAAPITCWLAARGGLTSAAALAAAQQISDSTIEND